MSTQTDESAFVKDEVQTTVQELPADQHERPFFPFQEDNARFEAEPRPGRFPRLGFGALIGAIFLIILSAILLRVIAGPAKVQADWTVHVWHTNRHVSIPKPAAWLSAILSFISVLFHIALSEGVNIAWWFQVRRESATIAELHELWDHGNSSWSAVKSGFKDISGGAVNLQRRLTHGEHVRRRIHFSYVALATLFVATIPLNGFLLQNAVTVESRQNPQNGTISVPIMRSDLTTTAIAIVPEDGDITRWSRDFGNAAVNVRPQLPAVADLKDFDTTCPDTCKAKVRGLGFKIDCKASTIRYNLTSDPYVSGYLGTEQMLTTGAQILSIGLQYDLSEKSTIQLRTMWKADADCAGAYSVQTCKLRMADVWYPIVINANVQEATTSGLINSTALSVDLDLLTQSPEVISTLPDGPVSFVDDVSYAAYTPALAAYLAQSFNSSIQMIYNNDGSNDYYSLLVTGVFAEAQIATNSEFTYDPTFVVAVPPCNRTFDTSQESVHTQLLAAIQSTAFQLAVYSNLQVRNNMVAGDYSDHPLAYQTYKRNEYVVIWPWYFGALATTLLIAGAISPLFYGYWLLPRKTTMSPLETARAFHAPVLYQEDARVVSSEVIKKVGMVQIHRDLGVITAAPV